MKMKITIPISAKDRKNNLFLCLFASTSLILGGCSQASKQESAAMTVADSSREQSPQKADNILEDNENLVNDPLEPLNRGIYFINMGIDGLIVKPIALLYRHILPEPVRNSVGRFYINLHAPVSLANHLLQGQPKRAGNTLVRFSINTTLGVLGLFDIAEGFGFKSKETGFGDTLGIWGVNTGPYLMIPALGPSSFRGTVGIVGDFFLQPYNYYFMNSTHNDDWISWTLTGVDLTHQRNLYLESIDELVANSIDPYVTFRSVYFQQQQHQLNELRAGS